MRVPKWYAERLSAMKVKSSATRASYGNCGRHRLVDPTPAEIKQRIAEVHQMRREQEAKRGQRREAMQRIVLDAIAVNGSMSARALHPSLNYGPATIRELLSSMEKAGLLIRKYGRAFRFYALPRVEDTITEPGLLSNDVLFRRVTGRDHCPA